jgi:hypothetical protein
MSSGKTPKPLHFGNVFGIWMLVLIVGAFVVFTAMYDPTALAITVFAVLVMFGIPYLVTRLWNWNLARLERKHYHAD